MGTSISAVSASIDSLFNSDGTPISSSQTASTSTTTSSTGEMDKQAFLKLLCTQLQNQDPLNPQDGAEMATQLAQFSMVEGIQNVKSAIEAQTEVFNSVVSTLQVGAQSTTNASAVSLIGKTVKLQQTTVDYDGTKVSFDVHLGNNNEATVKLLDEDGNIVQTFTASDKNDENSVTLTWDGLNNQGKSAATGTYTIQIENQDTDSTLYSFIKGKVNGVIFSDDKGVIIKIDGEEISIGDILEVEGS
jgi:flagellar basal-body rod modification protein FlgD